MIVAWHEVPGTTSTERTRPVGYCMIWSRCARPRESDRTLRDGSFGWCCPRHFVPGYDRTVPQEQKPFAFRAKKVPELVFFKRDQPLIYLIRTNAAS
jgi:hypothetical protein